MHNKNYFVERTRVLMAHELDIPPDDIDMSAIFSCVQRAIEENVDNNLSERDYYISPSNEREIRATISEIGEFIIPKIFNREQPFYDFVDRYHTWYKESLYDEFLKMKIHAALSEREDN
jgi:hypothetical protein